MEKEIEQYRLDKLKHQSKTEVAAEHIESRESEVKALIRSIR